MIGLPLTPSACLFLKFIFGSGQGYEVRTAEQFILLSLTNVLPWKTKYFGQRFSKKMVRSLSGSLSLTSDENSKLTSIKYKNKTFIGLSKVFTFKESTFPCHLMRLFELCTFVVSSTTFESRTWCFAHHRLKEA